MTLNRRILRVPLIPLAGSRFQPTGFPDLGAATFQRPLPDGSTEPCLLVESNQSMANRLEAVAWDGGSLAPAAELEGLPWVRVAADDGTYLTSSRTEAHRLASVYVKTATTADGTTMLEEIKTKLGLADERPLAPRSIAAAVFALDPMCLIHGVFFADKAWPGQPKITRSVTSAIEAHGVFEAVSGGVKRELVRQSLADKEQGGTDEGYGSVPFSRIEYTAREIEATFVVDLALLDSFGLPDDARALLEAIALWQIRTLLEDGLRLRTACDLTVADGYDLDQQLPAADRLASDIRSGISACAPLFGGTPLEVTWQKQQKKPKG